MYYFKLNTIWQNNKINKTTNLFTEPLSKYEMNLIMIRIRHNAENNNSR